MTHRHRYRRGVTPRPSEKHLRQWRRVLKRAEQAVKGRKGSGVAFAIAAATAAKAVMPVGHQGRDSVFMQLLQAAEDRLAIETPGDRAAWELGTQDLIDQCRTILAGVEPCADAAVVERQPRPRQSLPPRAVRLPYAED